MLRCPQCNSNKLYKHGKRWVKRPSGKRSVKATKIQQYRCKACGRITYLPKGSP